MHPADPSKPVAPSDPTVPSDRTVPSEALDSTKPTDPSDPVDLAVQRVAPAAVVSLRQRILRANRPLADSVYPGDDDPHTLHLGIAAPGAANPSAATGAVAAPGAVGAANALIACGTFVREPLRGAPAWRLRGMAVDAAAQRGGLGGRILRAAEPLLRAQGHSSLLWCNARQHAIGFYERHGWRVVSDVFDIADVGPHVVMTKPL